MIGNEQLQIGLYNQVASTGLVIYPYLPKTAQYPFVNLGEEMIMDVSTKNKKHYELYHALHTWSQSTNKAEINEINNKVIEAMSEPFPLGDGFYISQTRLESATVLLDPDVEALWHGNLRFVFTISKG
jgi:hypothetical protein